MTVRAALRQADMELVQRDLSSVAVRFASNLHDVSPARVTRFNPQATDVLPSEILGSTGGGPFSIRQSMPGDTGPRSIDRVFLVELVLPPDAAPLFGERAYVRFSHGTAPLATQIMRAVRQLFLREFDV